MKGQMSYIIKPITLVLIIALLIVLYSSINSSVARERKARQTLNLVNAANNILLVLANSKDCLAFRSIAASGLYANIVDVNKLNEFSSKYSDVEPECARSYDFGWRVNVTEISRMHPEQAAKAWEFGAKQFEDENDKSFRNSIEVSMPIAIRYGDRDVRPGLMTVTVVDGELEKIAGMFDWTCQMMKADRLKSFSVTIHTSHGITYDKGNDEICFLTKDRICKVMSCPLDFKELKSSGDYILTIKYNNGVLVVK